MSRHIIVGGGTGFIGKNLVQSLLNDGHKVTVVGRRQQQQQQQQQQQAASSMTWQQVKENGLPEDTHAICNLSGRSILEINPLIRLLSSKHNQYVSDVFNSRIQTTQCLLDAVKVSQCQVKAFVTASAIGYYPPHDNIIYTEDYSGNPDSGLAGRLCSQVERNLLDQQQQQQVNTSMRCIAARIGIVLGNNGGMMSNMWPAFYCGVGGRMASGKQGMAWIHIADCVELLKLALLDERVNTSVINVVAPANDDNAAFTAAFAAKLHRPAVLPMPQIAVDAIFGRDRSYIVTQGVRVQPKLAQDLGFQFQFPDLDSALGDLVGV